jgi:transcription antitermination factor NusG
VADRRDGITWVALELTRNGEKLVEEGKLEDELRKLLEVSEDWPVFVPARVFEKKGKRITVQLMEGYAFVATGLDEVHYFRVENTKLVHQVMAGRGSRNMRVLSVIPDSKIADLRRQLNEEVANDIIPGMRVLVTDGIYSKLEGTVLDIEDDHAVVHFELRSLKVISKVPKVFLDTTA